MIIDKEHQADSTYFMDGKKDLWQIVYYPLFQDGKTGEEYEEPRALMQNISKPGFWHKETPLRYLSTTYTELETYTHYWYPHSKKLVKKGTAKGLMLKEAYECQCIDTSCSDCKFYLRSEGMCLNSGCESFETIVAAHSNTCQPHNRVCFVHRKDVKQ